jgi:hypothetical protein
VLVLAIGCGCLLGQRIIWLMRTSTGQGVPLYIALAGCVRVVLARFCGFLSATASLLVTGTSLAVVLITVSGAAGGAVTGVGDAALATAAVGAACQRHMPHANATSAARLAA